MLDKIVAFLYARFWFFNIYNLVLLLTRVSFPSLSLLLGSHRALTLMRALKLPLCARGPVEAPYSRVLCTGAGPPG